MMPNISKYLTLVLDTCLVSFKLCSFCLLKYFMFVCLFAGGQDVVAKDLQYSSML